MLNQSNQPNYERERRFVDLARKVAEQDQNGNLTLFSKNAYGNLLRLSKLCFAGDEEARKIWQNLPERVQDFWPALNYLNQKRGH